MCKTTGLVLCILLLLYLNWLEIGLYIICDLLYLYDLFSINEYFMNRIESPIATMILQKLISEMNPYVENRTLEQYQLYFSKYQRAVQSVPFPITNGLVFEE